MVDVFQIVKDGISFEEICRGHGLEFNRNKKVACPYHDEKTASFHNFITHGYCFGCGKVADVIDIEVHFSRSSPLEATLSLAKKYGIRLPEFSKQDREKFDRQSEAFKLLEKLARYANERIKKHPEVLEFLKSKGLEEGDIKHWLIGYIRDENPLTKKLEKESEIKLAREIGLINEHEDYFKSRILIPIWNYSKIVYLTGRAYPDNLINEYNPKYLHLKNSELVHKQIAFAENLRKEKCLITESITEAVTFLKVGIPACALLGTNPGRYETESFLKTKTEPHFCFDNDEPGDTASYKLARKFQGYVVNLDSDKDCDELLAEKGISEFKKITEKAIKEAKSYMDLVIEREKIKEVLKEISKLRYASDKDLWLTRLAKKHKVQTSSLRKDLDSIMEERKKAAQSSGDGETLRQNVIDFLEDSRPYLHPSMSLVGGKLAYGIKRGDNSFFIFNREVVEASKISRDYTLSDDPGTSRFSTYGIKTYAVGKAEIHAPKLFERTVNTLHDFLVFKESWQPTIIAIWIIGTYLHRAFPLFPYLWIQSPTKRCGKSRLLELLSELCFNSEGLQTAPSEATLFRLPAMTAGVLCWDEAEGLHNHKEKGERLGILNTAYRKGAMVSRCEGESNEIKHFETYRPIALAGISYLPETVADRSLKIELIRKRKDEKVGRLQIDRLQSDFQSLRDGLYIFALERCPIIIECYDEFQDDLILDGVDDRLRDAFEVLFSIAGGIFYHHPDQFPPIRDALQNAVIYLSGIRGEDEAEVSFVKSISIIKEMFEREGTEEKLLTSGEAIDLFQKGGLEWVEELKQARRLLRKLGFHSDNHRMHGEVKRGYKISLKEIEDLWKRYG